MDIKDADHDAAAAAAVNAAPILRAAEAERYVEGLKTFSLREIGTDAWMEQHRYLEQLNLQAHQSAIAQSDDFVGEAFVTFEKVPVLVHELLAVEVWRENIYPRIKVDLCKNNSMRGYFMLYHEAVCCNILEVILFQDYVVEAAGDTLMELIDWCARRVVWLQSSEAIEQKMLVRDAMGGDIETFNKHMKEIEANPHVELDRQLAEIRYKTSVSAVVVSRFITQHISKLPPSIMTRVLDTHDFLLLMVPLLENPPWVRRTDEGVWQKYISQRWQEVKPENLLRLTRLEGQVWLLMYNLMCDGECRRRYHFNSWRKGTVLRVRKYINDVLVDQLPVLADVQRYMDELTIMKAPEAALAGSKLVMEAVPVLRESLIASAKGDWDAEAAWIMESIFSKTSDKDDKGLRAMAELYTQDNAAEVMDFKSPSAAVMLEEAQEDLEDIDF